MKPQDFLLRCTIVTVVASTAYHLSYAVRSRFPLYSLIDLQDYLGLSAPWLVLFAVHGAVLLAAESLRTTRASENSSNYGCMTVLIIAIILSSASLGSSLLELSGEMRTTYTSCVFCASMIGGLLIENCQPSNRLSVAVHLLAVYVVVAAIFGGGVRGGPLSTHATSTSKSIVKLWVQGQEPPLEGRLDFTVGGFLCFRPLDDGSKVVLVPRTSVSRIEGPETQHVSARK